jgi:hypothetical protein
MGQVTRQTLKDLRPEIEAALAAVGEKWGVTLTAGNGKYGLDGGVSGSLQLNITGTSVDGKSGKQVEFEQYSWMYDLAPEAFGQTFTSQGATFRVSGLKMQGQRFTITADKVTTGKGYKFGHKDVLRLLGEQFKSPVKPLRL